jgi:hypothetical protein
VLEIEAFTFRDGSFNITHRWKHKQKENENELGQGKPWDHIALHPSPLAHRTSPFLTRVPQLKKIDRFAV